VSLARGNVLRRSFGGLRLGGRSVLRSGLRSVLRSVLRSGPEDPTADRRRIPPAFRHGPQVRQPCGSRCLCLAPIRVPAWAPPWAPAWAPVRTGAHLARLRSHEQAVRPRSRARDIPADSRLLWGCWWMT